MGWDPGMKHIYPKKDTHSTTSSTMLFLRREFLLSLKRKIYVEYEIAHLCHNTIFINQNILFKIGDFILLEINEYNNREVQNSRVTKSGY